MKHTHCTICSEVMDPERCSDDELQEGVHSSCELSDDMDRAENEGYPTPG